MTPHPVIPDAEVVPPAEANSVFGSSIYPWDEWLDGQARYLSYRDHFPNFKSIESFIKYCRLIARKRNLRVEIRRDTHLGQICLRAKPGKIPRRSKHDATKNMEGQGKTSGGPVRNIPPGSQRRA